MTLSRFTIPDSDLFILADRVLRIKTPLKYDIFTLCANPISSTFDKGRLGYLRSNSSVFLRHDDDGGSNFVCRLRADVFLNRIRSLNGTAQGKCPSLFSLWFSASFFLHFFHRICFLISWRLLRLTREPSQYN